MLFSVNAVSAESPCVEGLEQGWLVPGLLIPDQVDNQKEEVSKREQDATCGVTR